jgi:maltose alpha-D-glucosyltransferase / alpha-amylase
VIYYGDEIGMGDNIYLGDRDGVRTPMQWSPDRNGGFSKVDPARLFLPPIQDAIYGFNGVNVEAQISSPSSLLNWMRRMIAVRRKQKAFGRGTLHFLYPSNRKVLAYLRRYEGETLLFLANVSRAPQAAELDLAEFRGCAPVELTVGSAFPQIGGLPYMLTLPSYGLYWFRLEKAVEQQRFGPAPAPELFTLVLTGSAAELLVGRERKAFERTIAPRFLVARRWFASKSAGVARVRLRGIAALPSARGTKTFLLAILDVELRNGVPDSYFTPLTVDEKAEDNSVEAYAVARVRRGSRLGLLYDADASSEFGIRMLDAFCRGGTFPLDEDGRLEFRTTKLFATVAEVDVGQVRRIGAEQSNSSLVLGNQMVLKLYRRLQRGIGLELEIGRFLAEVNFSNTPALLGSVEHVARDGTRTAVAILQRFVENQGDAWLWTLNALKRELEPAALSEAESPIDQAFATYWPYVELLGCRTAELHRTFASSEDPDFRAEPLTITDSQIVAEDARRQAEQAYLACESLRRTVPEANQLVMEFLGRRDEINAAINSLRAVAPGNFVKTRGHGDYHLGQVLIANNDVMIIDFEGEPLRPIEERRAKFSPMRDVAGMLRSFSYAANVAVRELSAGLEHRHAETLERALRWEERADEIFLASYAEATQGSVIETQDMEAQRQLLRLNLFAKVLYEINYEAGNRPDWIDIPLYGLLRLLKKVQEQH